MAAWDRRLQIFPLVAAYSLEAVVARAIDGPEPMSLRTWTSPQAHP